MRYRHPHLPATFRLSCLSAITCLVTIGSLLVSGKIAHADTIGGGSDPRKWALLIGIDQYEDSNHINPLSGAAADARAIGKALNEAAGFPADHVQLLVSDGDVRPTRTNILNALARLSKNAHSGDTVFVLYSGHGIEIDGTPYLLPYDTSALDDETVTDTALEAFRFRQRLQEVHAQALVLAFDMCRSDPRKSGKGIVVQDNPLGKTLACGLDFKRTTVAGAVIPTPDLPAASIAATLYSCSPEERSYEWEDRGRGYFSYFLEKGLRGAAVDPATGRVTIGALADYLGRTVRVATRVGAPFADPLPLARWPRRRAVPADSGGLYAGPDPCGGDAGACYGGGPSGLHQRQRHEDQSEGPCGDGPDPGRLVLDGRRLHIG